MHSILSSGGARVLARFAQAKPLLAFDYDGTLAPIARSPRTAAMRRTTRALLHRIAEEYPTVVISGRRYDDIAERLRDIGLRQVFGNHGIEPFAVNAARAALVRRWAARLATRLEGWPGVVIEDKTHSLAIHYRHAREHADARQAIDAALGELKGARTIDGTEAVNLVPSRGANKGVALRHACRLAGCEHAIYVGDDGTDEDAFMALPRSRILAVRVGRRRGSRASHVLRSQRDIDALLRLLLRVRRGPAAHRLQPPRP
jgi:trehalose 6-phosphate phosphatase